VGLHSLVGNAVGTPSAPTYLMSYWFECRYAHVPIHQLLLFSHATQSTPLQSAQAIVGSRGRPIRRRPVRVGTVPLHCQQRLPGRGTACRQDGTALWRSARTNKNRGHSKG